VEGPDKVMGENLFYLCSIVVQSKREKKVFFLLIRDILKFNANNTKKINFGVIYLIIFLHTPLEG
jgi:hypothetical protein